MNISVRRFIESDSSALKILLNELGYSLSVNDITNNIKGIRQKGGEVFVAEIECTIVGCICSIIDIRLAAGKYGELVSLVVTENYKGNGVGKKLVQHAEAWLSHTVSKIRVRANTIRKDAHGFYEALGYKVSKSQTIFTKEV